MKKRDYTELFAPTSLTALTYFMNLDSSTGRYYSANEIQKATHTGDVLLLTALRALVHCNILDFKIDGRAMLFRPNQDSTFLRNFKTLFSGFRSGHTQENRTAMADLKTDRDLKVYND